jgi:alkanesulfonate monooxygenase SsuD/methylene tetrahydromethanopterin reductase-like flavin-dependent oxidoreductase (luciferase family)
MEEFDILGLDFAKRGKRLEESLDIMISLFNNDITTYDGEHFKVPPIGLNPKPETRPHPPFHIGGHAKPALKRAALRGDGWIATAMSPEELKVAVDEIKAMRAAAGRDGLPFEVTCGVAVGGKSLDRDMVERYRDAGADRLFVSPWNRGREAVEALARFRDTMF